MTAFTTCVNSVLEFFLAVAGGSGFAATVREGNAPNLGRLILQFPGAWEAVWVPMVVRSLYNYHSRRRDTIWWWLGC